MIKNNISSLEKKLKETYELFNVKLFNGELPKAYPRRWYKIFNSSFSYKDIDKTEYVKFLFCSAPKERFSMKVKPLYGKWDDTGFIEMFPKVWKNRRTKWGKEKIREFLQNLSIWFKGNRYEITLNASTSGFKKWLSKLKGFESTLLHEMFHIRVCEKERKYAPRLAEDWESPFWDREDTTWDDYYINAVILFGELLSKSKKDDIQNVFNHIRWHHLEFFMGCYITADFLMNCVRSDYYTRYDLMDIRKIFNIRLDKKLPQSKKWKMLEDLTNEFYGYTTRKKKKERGR